MRPLLTLLLAAPLLGAADEPPADDPPTTFELLRTLRDRRSHLDDKEPAVEALLARGPEARRALAEELERQLERHAKDWGKTVARLEKEFADAAPRVLERRLGRSEEAELEELRKQVRTLGRSKSLTKGTIRSRLDPLVQRIEALVTVTADQVYDAEEDVEEALFEALDLYDQSAVLRDWFDGAREAMASDPDGEKYLGRLDEPVDLDGADRALVDRLAAIAELSTPMRAADAETLASNAALAAELDPFEVQGIRILNLRRVHLGLAALRIDVKLCAAGRDHSKDMVELDFFDHTSPVEGKRTLGQRAANFGTSASGENISRGHADGAGSFGSWWYSPGHHRNMMGGYGRVGLGRHETTWTQMFG